MAVTTNKNEWVNTFANAIGASGDNAVTPTGGQKEEGNTDKYAALETTSYKDMLSSKIQANNAKDQALKYASASLGASGLAGQGMAESTRAGIMGSYQRAINDADIRHNQNVLDIEAQRQADLETKGEENWQSVMTMLSQATSKEDLDYLKNNFYANMTDDQKRMFDYYYASYNRDLGAQSTAEVAQWAERVFQTSELKEDDGITFNNFTKKADLYSSMFKDKADVTGIEDVKNFYMTANNGELVEVNATNGDKSGSEYFMFYNGKLFKIDSSILNGRTPKARITLSSKK